MKTASLVVTTAVIFLAVASGLVAVNHTITESHRASYDAVRAVSGFVAGENPVTFEQLTRCKSANPALLERAMVKINATVAK